MRVALCIRGGVSRVAGHYQSDAIPKTLSPSVGYANYSAVGESVRRHIIGVNKNASIDVFVHSWSVDLEEQINSIYAPIASVFEDNELYADDIRSRCREPKDFGGVSQALAIKKVVEIKENYERSSGAVYDKVVLYRPDVLLWKDMVLSDYDTSSAVFVNAHAGGGGDFHFVMSSEDASAFKGLYDSSLNGNPHREHHWTKSFVEQFMKRPLLMDQIVPGLHQEVVRPDKIRDWPIKRNGISPSLFFGYGLDSKYLGLD